MYSNLYLLLFILLLSHEVLGKNGSKTRNLKNLPKRSNNKNGKLINERGKRSLTEIEKSFLSHISKDLQNDNFEELAKYTSEDFINNEEHKNLEKELPFWGTRGRRDSSSESTEKVSDEEKNKATKCSFCDKYFHDFHKNVIKEELDPFWFERGVKDKSKEFSPFWGNRGRRDEMEPFWGNRGRRDEMEPFWGNRGRRDETEPFWGNRGRRDEMEPFWGNRGRRDEVEPFWGNRGRRDENEPFWGNRGRREEPEPFWGARGRRETKNSIQRNSFWEMFPEEERKKTALKDSIIGAMDKIKFGIDKLSRMRRVETNSFWESRGRNSKLENMFKQQTKNRSPYVGENMAQQNTVLDERMYAEQPHYILIERSSRSSGEEDPFFISRGKKFTNNKLLKGFRDRRGALEELVKSVRADPYYIARGKKDSDYVKIGNSTILKDKFAKAKELICSTIDLLVTKDDNFKFKRDEDEAERDRRTTLKKLAAQLQMDPYFVSRGKKSGEVDSNDDHLEEFINHVSDMCY